MYSTRVSKAIAITRNRKEVEMTRILNVQDPGLKCIQQERTPLLHHPHTVVTGLITLIHRSETAFAKFWGIKCQHARLEQLSRQAGMTYPQRNNSRGYQRDRPCILHLRFLSEEVLACNMISILRLSTCGMTYTYTV